MLKGKKHVSLHCSIIQVENVQLIICLMLQFIYYFSVLVLKEISQLLTL